MSTVTEIDAYCWPVTRTAPRVFLRDLIERVGIEIYRPARWICNPCHNLQPVTPTENILAMYETIHRFGK